MAKKTTVVTYDDLDGTIGAEPIEFGLDGVGLVIDLTGRNAAILRDALAPYVAAARVQSPRRGSAGDRGSEGPGYAATKARREYLARVRDWWRGQGYDIAPAGRVSAEILSAFDRAQSPEVDLADESGTAATHAATTHAATTHAATTHAATTHTATADQGIPAFSG